MYVPLKNRLVVKSKQSLVFNVKGHLFSGEFSDVALDFQNHQTLRTQWDGHLQTAESKRLVFPKSTQTLVFFYFSVTGTTG